MRTAIRLLIFPLMALNAPVIFIVAYITNETVSDSFDEVKDYLKFCLTGELK